MDTVPVLLFSVLLFGILGLFLIRGLNNRTITGLERQSTITYMGNNFVSDGHICNAFCLVLLKLVNV